MHKRKIDYWIKWSMFSFIVIGVCAMAGCNSDGSVKPLAEWFAPGPDGTTAFDETTGPLRDVAGLLGPPGEAIALGVGGVGLVGTAVYRLLARRQRRRLADVGPVAQKLIYNLASIKEDQPDVWAKIKPDVAAGMNADDRIVIDHFRPDRDTKLKHLKGVES